MAAIGAYKAVERALSSMPGVDTDQAKDAINRNIIESAVDDQGVRAVNDEEVLQAAIDRNALDTAVDLNELRNSIADSIGSDDQ